MPLSLSLSLRTHTIQCITYICCKIDKPSDSLTVRKGVQPQLPTQNKLLPCSSYSSDLKISLESGHSSDITISLQVFTHFKQISSTVCLPKRASLLLWQYQECLFYTLNRKWKLIITFKQLLSVKCLYLFLSLSLSLRPHTQTMFYLYLLRNGQTVRQFNR